MEETFKNIKKLRAHIKDMFLNLTAKKDVVSSYYIQYIEKNKKNKMFGLDSFHFQSKLIELEYKHLHDEYLFMDNRIYCDYYKLYGMVATFCKQNFKTDYKFVMYPVYKDLDPYRAYDFETINNIHYNIIDLIQFIHTSIKNGEDEINRDKNRLKTGLNLENYIHNLEYKNNILISNVQLYENYLNSYHIYHMNFLRKLSDKISLFWKQLSNGMQVNDETLSQEFRENDSELKTADEILNDIPNDLVSNEIINILVEPLTPKKNKEFISVENYKIVNIDYIQKQEEKDQKYQKEIETKEEIIIDDNEEPVIVDNDDNIDNVDNEEIPEYEKNEKEKPRQRGLENSREIESQEDDLSQKETSLVSFSFDETRETSSIDISIIIDPLLSEEYIYEKKDKNENNDKNDNNDKKNVEEDKVHIVSQFINEKREEEVRDSAIERNAMVPEVCVENILNEEFVGIKESIVEPAIVTENKKKRKKKKN
jgi:hypothetical protein